MTNKNMVETVKLFAALGIPVFPISPGSKIPYKNTSGVKEATTSVQTIEQWFNDYPDANWAMAAGKGSGILVLDIDPRNGGLDSIQAEIKKYGAPPKTPTVKTGGGGYHFYYRYPNFSNIKNGEILPGVDIKTDGGYVLIPGSVTDDVYTWAKGLSNTEINLAELPGWIVELASARRNMFLDTEELIVVGNRNNYLTSLAGSMRRRGMGENSIRVAIREENIARCSPPLGPDEVDRLVDSIMNYRPDDEILLKFMDGDGEDADIKADAIKSENVIIAYLLSDDYDELFLAEIFGHLLSEHFSQSHARDIYVAARELYEKKATVSAENIDLVITTKGLDISIQDIKSRIRENKTLLYLGDITFHSERIIEAWTLSKSVEIFKRSLTESGKGNRSARNIITETTSHLMRLVDSGGKNNMLTTPEAVRQVQKMMSDSQNGIFQAVQKTGLDFLDEIIMGLPKGEITIVAGRPSQGAAFTNESVILTPWGTTTYGEVMPGDYVFGSDGKPTRVLRVFPQGTLPVYEVVFKDGTVEKVSGEHLWAVNGRNQRKRGLGKFDVVTTDYIRERIVKNNGRTNFVTPVAPHVHYPAKRLPIDPYVLGVLLADGGLTTNYIGITTGDPWVIEEVGRRLPNNHIMRKIPNKPYEYTLVNPVTRRNEIKQHLRDLGLDGLGSWDKFIPEMYLRASVEQRVALLQGLMDSDGSVNGRTSARYLTASTRLSDGIMELVRSLGGYITHTIRKAEGKEYQRLYMSFPGKPAWKPFLLPRKADIYEHYEKTYYGKPIVDVRPAGEAECVCIQVEAEDGLYLTANYNVTHNTAFALKIAYSVAEQVKNKGAVVIFSAEMSAKQLMARNISREAKVNSKYLRDARKIDIEDRIRVDKAIQYINENITIYIDETPNPSPQYIAAKLAAINSRTPVALAVLDYIELGGSDEDDSWAHHNKSLRIEENLKKYKIIAKTMDIPFLLLSQLSRQVEERASASNEPYPRMSDLSWSDMIGKIANVIMMLYYPWFFYNSGIPYNEAPEKDYYEIIIGKNRDGEVGVVPARFIKEYGDFESRPVDDYIEVEGADQNEFAWDKV